MSRRWPTKAILLTLATILLALHWVCLRADPAPRVALLFGQDASSDLYTDEGLDSAGAIAAARYGHWYLPGQFNLTVDAPLWSAMLHPLFQAEGVHIAAARSLQICFFAASVLLLYLFIEQWRLIEQRRPGGQAGADSVAAWTALLLSANFLAFSFSRMAILESVWTFFVLASLLLATLACRKASLLLAYAAGLCLACAVLTKLTALFALLPLSAVFLLYRTRTRWLALGISACAGAGTLLLPFAYVVATRFPADHHYYRQVNIVARAVHSPLAWLHNVAYILASVRYFDLPLSAAFLIGLFFFRHRLRHWRDEPLAVIFGLWIIGDLLVSNMVAYFPPRYLLNPLFPFAALTVLFAENALRSSRAAGRLLYGLLVAAALVGTVQMAAQLAHPRYTLQATADSIAAQVAARPSAVLMGDFAYTMSLYAKIQPMDDGFGVLPRSARIVRENPAFYLTLGPASPDRQADFAAASRRLALIRTYDALDNYVRGKQIYLYRVESAN
ncbi:MAG TPA: phospholipid carrier-dependent glycosyltransferase [Acidobacteriaceae bacterium]